MYTETEMKEIFQNIVDQVATLSTQAAQVETLRQDVSNLTVRLNDLESENGRLRDELRQAQAYRDEATAKLAEVQSSYDSELAVSFALRETIVAGNSKVGELQSDLTSEIDSHRITKADLKDARRASQEWEAKYVMSQGDLGSMTNDRDYWQGRATDTEARFAELQSKFDRVMSVLNPPHSVANVA